MRVILFVGLIVFVLSAGTLVTGQTQNEPTRVLTTAQTTTEAQPQSREAKEKTKPLDKRVGPSSAQSKTGAQEKPATALTSRAILGRLQLEIKTSEFEEKMKFRKFLQEISKRLKAQDRAVTIDVDIDPRELGAEAPLPFDEEISIFSNRENITVIDALRQALKQICRGRAGLVIRAGKVEIVDAKFLLKDHMLNQFFRADFKDQRLDLALEELSELTGVSIIVDARAKPKVQTPVTARFNDDVALQDAVRMLTETAELKIVHLVTGLYITTPEHAKVMKKELREIYEPPAPINPGGMMGMTGMMGGGMGMGGTGMAGMTGMGLGGIGMGGGLPISGGGMTLLGLFKDALDLIRGTAPMGGSGMMGVAQPGLDPRESPLFPTPAWYSEGGSPLAPPLPRSRLGGPGPGG